MLPLSGMKTMSHFFFCSKLELTTLIFVVVFKCTFFFFFLIYQDNFTRYSLVTVGKHSIHIVLSVGPMHHKYVSVFKETVYLQIKNLQCLKLKKSGLQKKYSVPRETGRSEELLLNPFPFPLQRGGRKEACWVRAADGSASN